MAAGPPESFTQKKREHYKRTQNDNRSVSQVTGFEPGTSILTTHCVIYFMRLFDPRRKMC